MTTNARRLVLIVGTIAILLLTSKSAHGQFRRDSRARASILPDTGSAIAEITLHYDSAFVRELMPVYLDLFQHLSKNVRLRVLCSSPADVEDFVENWELEEFGLDRELQLITADRELSLWARDRRIARHYAAIQRPAPTIIPAGYFGYDHDKINELALLPTLRMAGLEPAGVQRSLIHLEGGNIVSNDRHVFVGANVIKENLQLGLTKGEIHKELERILGRPFVLVQDCLGDVPWCHVDMYLTPVDDQTVLVASPALGRRMLGSRQSSTERPELDLPILQTTSVSLLVQKLYDSVADQVADLGYRIVRLPAVVDSADEWMVTYNNVLLEQRGRQKIVYMPVYGVPALDRGSERIYRGLGFEVKTIDVSQIFELGGAVRCLANVTERSDSMKQASSPRRAGTSLVRVYTVVEADQGAQAIEVKSRACDDDPILASELRCLELTTP